MLLAFACSYLCVTVATSQLILQMQLQAHYVKLQKLDLFCNCFICTESTLGEVSAHPPHSVWTHELRVPKSTRGAKEKLIRDLEMCQWCLHSEASPVLKTSCHFTKILRLC